jgi:anti-sigma-K factor RskA
MAEYDELAELVRLAAPPFNVPVGLEERVFARIAPPQRRRRLRLWWLAAPVAVAAAAAAFLVAGGSELERYELRGGGAQVSATVQTTGVGREVTIEIDRLRDPRPDGLYELWFVAPDGRRVSAGTFHPDDEGRGTVRLVGAADPMVYTQIRVSLEPADGKPRRQGPDVLRAVPAG